MSIVLAGTIAHPAAMQEQLAALSTHVNAQAHTPSQGARPVRDVPLAIPQEVPVELRYNGHPHATMMASPDALIDFATGFTLSEAIASSVSNLKNIECTPCKGGITVDVTLHGSDYAVLLRDGARAMPGRSGCGICGLRALDDVRRGLPKAPAGVPVSQMAINRALSSMQTSHGLHAAAFCDLAGSVRLARQDVGRHNALDKLIGAMSRGAQQGHDAAQGFCLLTSRCSYEMVQKAVRGGFSAVVAMSSPTSLAVDIARDCGLTLIALASPDRHTLFVDGRTAEGAP